MFYLRVVSGKFEFFIPGEWLVHYIGNVFDVRTRFDVVYFFSERKEKQDPYRLKFLRKLKIYLVTRTINENIHDD